MEAQRRNSLFGAIKRSPSAAQAGLALTIAEIPPHERTGVDRLQLEEWHGAATSPAQEDFPWPSSSSK